MSILNHLIKSAAAAGGDTAAPEGGEEKRKRPEQSLTIAEKPKFNPILGLKYIKAVLDHNDVASFQQTDVRHLHEEELTIYNFCKKHLRSYGRLPEPDTVRSNGYVLDIVSGETAAYYAKRLSDREVSSAVTDGQKLLNNAIAAGGDTDIITSILRTQLASVLAVTRSSQLSTLHSLALEVMADFRLAKMQPGLIGAPLAYATLNDSTGGLLGSELCIIVGRPGVGKTILFSELLLANYLAGFRCLVCSNEMPAKQLVRRLLGRQAGINHALIKKGQVSTLGERRLNQTVQFIEGGPEMHFINGSFNQTVSALESTVAQFGPDIVFVDAAYLLKSLNMSNRASQTEKQEQIVREIKGFLMDSNLPGVATYQLNRDEKDRNQGKRHRVDLGSIGGTDAVGKDADVILALLRAPAPYNHTHRLVQGIKFRDSDPVDFAINFIFDPPDYSEVPLESILGAPDAEEDETNIDSMR